MWTAIKQLEIGGDRRAAMGISVELIPRNNMTVIKGGSLVKLYICPYFNSVPISVLGETHSIHHEIHLGVFIAVSKLHVILIE